MIGFSTAFMTRLGLGAPRLIPYPSFLETARIAVSPATEREMSLPMGMAVDAGLRLARRVVPPIFRMGEWLRPTRPSQESEEARPGAGLPDAVENGFCRAYLTHPALQHVRRLWDEGRDAPLLDYLSFERCRIPVFLFPVLRAVVAEVVSRNPLMARHGLVKDRLLERHEEWAARQARFPMEAFGKSNVRGSMDYERDLFPGSYLTRIGVKLKAGDTVLWRMTDRLPAGAVVADWGSGAGVFGREIHMRRPDLRIFSLDKSSPEEIIAMTAEPPAPAEELRRHQSFLTGDALSLSLPPDQRADLLVQVFLLPWVEDPLALMAHMYNQLRPGGLMIATLHAESYDATRDWSQARSVMTGLLEDLRRMGVDVDATSSGRTAAIRRLDERVLRPRARLVHSSYEEVLTGFFGSLPLQYSFYRPSGGPLPWVSLE